MQCRVDTFRRGSRARGWRGRTIAIRDHSNEILGVTHATRGTPALAGLAIGLTLTLIHLTSIPVDNTSVNPARSIAAAIYGGTDALAQLWAFILFPIVGALLAGFAHRALFERTNI